MSARIKLEKESVNKNNNSKTSDVHRRCHRNKTNSQMRQNLLAAVRQKRLMVVRFYWSLTAGACKCPVTNSRSSISVDKQSRWWQLFAKLNWVQRRENTTFESRRSLMAKLICHKSSFKSPVQFHEFTDKRKAALVGLTESWMGVIASGL